MANPNDSLISLVRGRKASDNAHNRGILTADRYVRTLQDCVGSDLCYRYGSKGKTSFDDVIRKSTRQLTYNAEGMEVSDVYHDFKGMKVVGPHGDVELPKNTLMVFKHVLTSNRQDRDQDILHPKGASIDLKMLLLWQHVHTLPIGKMLGILEHTEKRIVAVSALVDVNDLASDAATMIEAKMGRFSHGFRATKFSKIKEDSGKTSSGGFEVKEFEIMEESLVSVPANPDAEVLEVYLDMIESDKLSSSIMKGYGQTIKAGRAVSVATGFDLEDFEDDDETGEKSADAGCGCSGKGKGKPCGCDSCTSEKADDNDGDDDEKPKGDTESKEGMMCPKCKIKLIDGECPDCGYKMADKPSESDDKPKKKPPAFGGDDGDDDDKKDETDLDEKAGRVLSKSLYGKMKSVSEDLKEIDGHCSTRSGKALCAKCRKTVDEVLEAAKMDDPDAPKGLEDCDTKEIAGEFLIKATAEDRNRMAKALEALALVDDQDRVTKEFRALKAPQ